MWLSERRHADKFGRSAAGRRAMFDAADRRLCRVVRLAGRVEDRRSAMKAIRGHDGEPVLTEVDEAPGHGELITMRAAGICASDFMYLALGTERVLGHELAGVRADGTPVIVEGLFGCGECEYCRSGRNNLCARASTMALG